MASKKHTQPSKLEQQGKFLLPSYKLQCFSVACHDMPNLEFGDKIILPPKILLELQCLKIATPLLFMVRAAGLAIKPEGDLDSCGRQYCSVQEFSAPDDQVFLPYWLMQNLHVGEGDSVVVTSAIDLPRGIYCRLQPETTSFLDLVAEIGPKLLMETALRRYSVLSVNSTIVIEYGNVRYYVRVAELKPASVVSLCGDVDLETDFMSPQGSDPKRPSTGKSTTSNESCFVQPSVIGETNSLYNNSPLSTTYGRRLRDGCYIENPVATPSEKEKALQKICLQKAQQTIRDKQSRSIFTEAVAAAAESPVLAAQLRFAQRAFTTPGHTLGAAVQSLTPNSPATLTEQNTSQLKIVRVDEANPDCDARPSVHKCKLCMAEISAVAMELHTLRCAKNQAYHKFECSTCDEKILRVNEKQHQHCPKCTLLCESSEKLADHERFEHTASCKCKFCGESFTHTELENHQEDGRCDHVLVPCSLCGLAFKKKEIAQHSRVCSSRTERCDICKKYTNIMEFDTHVETCGVLAPQQESSPSDSATNINANNAQALRKLETSIQDAVECAYCLQGGFPTISAVEYHALYDCRIAKSFTACTVEPVEIASTNQEETDQIHVANSDDVEEPQSDDVQTRPLLAQGRMRRKEDANALHRNSSSRQQFNSNQANHHPTTRRTSPIPLKLSTLEPQQTVKLRKPKPKPRPNPQLQALPQRTSKIPTTAPNLCISNAGGPLSSPLHPVGNTRFRRHPTRLAKLP